MSPIYSNVSCSTRTLSLSYPYVKLSVDRLISSNKTECLSIEVRSKNDE